MPKFTLDRTDDGYGPSRHLVRRNGLVANQG